MTDATPNPDDLWVLLNESDKNSSNDRFAIARITEERDDGDYRAEILYDTILSDKTPFTMNVVPEDVCYAELPDHDEWDEQFEDALDHLRGYLTPKDVADLLDGEPSYATGGRRGFRALRLNILEGVSESLTEYSIGHGHGPSAYGRSVRNAVEDLPRWLAEAALESERERWEGGFYENNEAAYIVEVLEVKQDILDADCEDEIRELVNEFNLPYESYLDGHFTAQDCPNCGAELIERPEEDYDYIHLDCSECDSAFEATVRESGLVVRHELEGGDN